MHIKTQSKGREYTGIEIGYRNVRRYFAKQNNFIELALDHLQIQCSLAPGFWNGEPQICDPRLSAWLESKNFRGKSGHNPISLELIPCGNNSFRLEQICTNGRARNKLALGPD
jgi:hypothetical protein